jgi:hypothetical protein
MESQFSFSFLFPSEVSRAKLPASGAIVGFRSINGSESARNTAGIHPRLMLFSVI